jgi:hypothetical protein|tara:strand:- start:74 stop:421 length:348 start_codon:yes stop_codon:yes gene_type:complete
MKEADVKDSHGNVVISPGLKVRHKDSQFEYTVNQVLEEPGGEVTVMLSPPEAPRFEPAGEAGVISDRNQKEKVLYEVEPVGDLADLFYIPSEEETEEEDLLAVSSKEFEKEYEVR